MTRPPLHLRRPFLAGIVRQLPLLAAILVVGAGLVLVTFGQWRSGLVVIGLAMVGAALLRLLLPVRRVGFLAVRSRPVDIVLLTGMGLALVGAGLLRLVLPVRRVGFLAVRSRPVDVVLMAVCGLALTVIALAIPGG